MQNNVSMTFFLIRNTLSVITKAHSVIYKIFNYLAYHPMR